jgi:eukaryotic-like serine/threonine-protein kinase
MDRIGKFVIHKQARTSGPARVFFCHDPDLLVPVAIKLYTPLPNWPLSPGQSLARFQAEARALAAFDHPQIIQVKSMDSLDGHPYFVMPYQAAHLPYEMGKDDPDPSRPQADQPRRLPLPRAMVLIKQIAAAIATVHRRGMVHRHVKPSNILLTSRDGGQIKLADFSLAKLPEKNPPMPDHWVGDTAYCAPEQRENATTVQPQADVFSLGMLAARMLTGCLADSALGSVELPASFPAALIDLIARSTAPDPAQRPIHGGAFLLALSNVVVDSTGRPAFDTIIPREKASR